MKPDLLLRMRERAGLTQTTLAERLGVTQSTISNAERGNRAPSLDLLESWAAACGYELVVLPRQLAEQLDASAPPTAATAQGQPLPLPRPTLTTQIDLRALRDQAGLTQRALADELGVGASYIGKLERGEREVDLSLAQRWARACGQEIGLLDRADADLLKRHHAVAADDQALLDALANVWSTLPESRRQDLRVLIRSWLTP